MVNFLDDTLASIFRARIRPEFFLACEPKFFYDLSRRFLWVFPLFLISSSTDLFMNQIDYLLFSFVFFSFVILNFGIGKKTLSLVGGVASLPGQTYYPPTRLPLLFFIYGMSFWLRNLHAGGECLLKACGGFTHALLTFSSSNVFFFASA